MQQKKLNTTLDDDPQQVKISVISLCRLLQICMRRQCNMQFVFLMKDSSFRERLNIANFLLQTWRRTVNENRKECLILLKSLVVKSMEHNIYFRNIFICIVFTHQILETGLHFKDSDAVSLVSYHISVISFWVKQIIYFYSK